MSVSNIAPVVKVNFRESSPAPTLSGVSTSLTLAAAVIVQVFELSSNEGFCM